MPLADRPPLPPPRPPPDQAHNHVNLTLSVPEAARDSDSSGLDGPDDNNGHPARTAVRINKEQAARTIAYLAIEGFLDRSVNLYQARLTSADALRQARKDRPMARLLDKIVVVDAPSTSWEGAPPRRSAPVRGS